MSDGRSHDGRAVNWRRLSLGLVVGGTVVFVAANGHLVYTALTSQPDCVPHMKSPGSDGTYRAARSAC
ncbi:MAG TPA: hypothetical protein VNQ99_09420 [Xanthobacteraceae bacterium]|nr:hypothetical protein [Xanthobacteraceae bacterium]